MCLFGSMTYAKEICLFAPNLYKQITPTYDFQQYPGSIRKASCEIRHQNQETWGTFGPSISIDIYYVIIYRSINLIVYVFRLIVWGHTLIYFVYIIVFRFSFALPLRLAATHFNPVDRYSYSGIITLDMW